jgi:hypothetical protein
MMEQNISNFFPLQSIESQNKSLNIPNNYFNNLIMTCTKDKTGSGNASNS